ncbi:hypothetical protein WG909_13700 [Peptostreptococcaceae bacterium AGR-M142]
MKKIISLILISLIVLSLSLSSFAEETLQINDIEMKQENVISQVNYKINDKLVTLDESLLDINGLVYVTNDSLLETLGFNMYYSYTKRAVFVEKDDKRYVFPLNSTMLEIYDLKTEKLISQKDLYVDSLINNNDKYYIPVNVILRDFEFVSGYDSLNKTFIILDLTAIDKIFETDKDLSNYKKLLDINKTVDNFNMNLDYSIKGAVDTIDTGKFDFDIALNGNIKFDLPKFAMTFKISDLKIDSTDEELKDSVNILKGFSQSFIFDENYSYSKNNLMFNKWTKTALDKNYPIKPNLDKNFVQMKKPSELLKFMINNSSSMYNSHMDKDIYDNLLISYDVFKMFVNNDRLILKEDDDEINVSYKIDKKTALDIFNSIVEKYGKDKTKEDVLQLEEFYSFLEKAEFNLDSNYNYKNGKLQDQDVNMFVSYDSKEENIFFKTNINANVSMDYKNYEIEIPEVEENTLDTYEY